MIRRIQSNFTIAAVGGLAWTGILLAFSGTLRADSLQWKTQPGYRVAELRLEQNHSPGFIQQFPQTTGVVFTNFLSEETSLTNTIVNNGSGVALGDVDGDGWCDLYFCRLEGPNVLYRNRGDWHFEDITDAAGVACPGQFSTGAVLADVDGDGDLDLLVNAIGGGTRLFLNDGRGRFLESAGSGLLHQFGSTSMALADIDGDGDLDLYVANYRATTIMDQPQTRFSVAMVDGRPVLTKVNGIPVTHSELAHRFTLGPDGTPREAGEADRLYFNDGRGHFQEASFTNVFRNEEGRPAEVPYDWGLSVMFRDMNGDLAPDLYVCNDTDSPDRIWINDGHGGFRSMDPLAVRHTSLSSMGVDFADLDRDGLDDFLVVDMQARRHRDRMSNRETSRLAMSAPGQFAGRPQVSRNTLFWNRGDGTYAEVALIAGLQSSDWSWTPLFLDVDLDGFEDLLIANGFHRNVLDSDSAGQIARLKAGQRLSGLEELRLRSLFPRWESPHEAYRNLGGWRFEEVGAVWGFGVRGVANGMAEGDLDNDGDLDVVLNQLNGPAVVLRNAGTAPRVAVRLKGRSPNTRGIGARVKMSGGPVEQTQELISGGRYLSGGEALRVFAAGAGTNLTLEVKWRGGGRSVVRGVRPDQEYEVDEAGADEAPKPVAAAPPAPLFAEADGGLGGHGHHEAAYDDGARQPLLPRPLSTLGPGVGWCDLNGDGFEDLIVGTGRGGRLGVLAGNGRGGFAAVASPAWSGPAADDLTGLVAWPGEAGAGTVLVGEANYESGATNGPAVRSYEVFFGEVRAGAEVPGNGSSVGPLAVADVEGDGDLDLFVGGRVVGGRYPAGAESRLYRRAGERWVRDEGNTRVLAGAGLVSGAVWSDLDGDGLPELVLACEWGPVRVYANRGGELSEATAAWGLGGERGWWTGVTAGDLDGDGRLDLVVGNWGRNTAWEEALGEELRVYYGDVDGNGTWEVIEGQWDGELKQVVPRRDGRTVGRAVPGVAERFGSYRAYGEAGLEEIYGAGLKGLGELRVKRLDSMVFLNRGDHFEGRALPWEAQLAPVFGVCVGDADGDGREDVFVSQNFFGTDPESGRNDAGRGLWLRGDGAGNLRAVAGAESGVRMYGEGRGAALGDYDGDGRVDLVVGQNGAATRLYHNVGGRAGLRVRLAGPPGNPAGLGAVLRLGADGGSGPARELHGGSGYWSQDSALSVLARGPATGPATLQVTWPGGRRTPVRIPPDAREVRLNTDGQLQTIR